MKSTGTNDHPGVIAFPPFLFLGAAALSAAVHFLLPGPVMLRHDISIRLGIALVATALTLMISAITVMMRAGTNVHPREPTLTIVRKGPYRFTRNPMYLGLVLLQLALGFFVNDWSPVLIAVPLMLLLHYGVILREEKYLEAKFGEQYLALKQNVRRWL